MLINIYNNQKRDKPKTAQYLVLKKNETMPEYMTNVDIANSNIINGMLFSFNFYLAELN
jgi:hypothetical protein